jgi:hypothetical protein
MLLSLYKRLSDIITVIIMLPVALIGLIVVSLYWMIKFPFWYIERKKWWRGKK